MLPSASLLRHSWLLLAFVVACGSSGPSGDPPGPGPGPGPGDSPVCLETCDFSADGECDDGASGSITNACAYGTDCIDCGSRPPMSAMPPLDAGSGMQDSGPDECPCDTTFFECDEGCACDSICDAPATGQPCFCESDFCAGDASCRPQDACYFAVCARRCTGSDEDCPSGTTCVELSPFRQICQ